jgi:DNA-binding LacI/PurR family transcriptional regulator
MNAILRARNITGVIVMSFESPQDWPDLAWDKLSAVRMFNPLCHPYLHAVSPDHHQLLLHGLEHVTRFGYRRVGLYLRHATDARIHGKWSAAFHVYQQTIPAASRIPPLYFDQFDPTAFMSWFHRHRPDAIVGHGVAALDCLSAHGVCVPTEVGFINLNVSQELRPCAGLDLRPDLIGAAAVDTVIALINRNERGVPTTPHTLQIEGSWIDGPTLIERERGT